MTMRARKLGTITIGQAPRPDITPILDAAIGPEVARLHVGLLDGLADYRVTMIENRLADYRRVLENRRAQYAAALEPLAGPSTLNSIPQSRFDEDAVQLAAMEDALRTRVS